MSESRNRPLHGYTLIERAHGRGFEKRYVGDDAFDRLDREVSCLRALRGVVPVAAVAKVDIENKAVVVRAVGGVNGHDLMARGRAREVLIQAGRTLAVLQACRYGDLAQQLPGQGAVVVHGDFGPQNLLLNSDAAEVRAVVDWEFAHMGRMEEDLAWAEWMVRMLYPYAVVFLAGLYEGFGGMPAWAARHAAMLDTCQLMLERSRAEGPSTSVQWWLSALDTTQRWSA